MSKQTFKWDDPFLFNDQLTDEERMIRDTARKYCQDKLMPRILEANRNETFDRTIMNEMGSLGFLGCTLPEEYGGAGLPLRAGCVIFEEIDAAGCTSNNIRAQMYMMGMMVKHGTPAQIRAEVKHRIETLGPAGLLLAPAYDLDYAPFENVVAFVEAVRDYGAVG